MATIKCMSMDVYRHVPYMNEGYDPTNGGISGISDVVYIPHPHGTRDIDEDDPRLMRVVFRDIFGRKVTHIEPYKPAPEGHVSWMVGGNFAASSDSRVSEALGGFYGAVSIHDRTETWEEYEILSH